MREKPGHNFEHKDLGEPLSILWSVVGAKATSTACDVQHALHATYAGRPETP
jgi:hypothetical protein